MCRERFLRHTLLSLILFTGTEEDIKKFEQEYQQPDEEEKTEEPPKKRLKKQDANKENTPKQQKKKKTKEPTKRKTKELKTKEPKTPTGAILTVGDQQPPIDLTKSDSPQPLQDPTLSPTISMQNSQNPPTLSPMQNIQNPVNLQKDLTPSPTVSQKSKPLFSPLSPNPDWYSSVYGKIILTCTCV